MRLYNALIAVAGFGLVSVPALADDAKIEAGKAQLKQAIATLDTETTPAAKTAEALMRQALNALEAPSPAASPAPIPPTEPKAAATAPPAASPATPAPKADSAGVAGYKAGAIVVVREAHDDPTEISSDDLGQFTLTGPTISAGDLSKKKITLGNGAAAGYELQGWLSAKAGGRYQVSVQIDAKDKFGWRANCALTGSVEGTPIVDAKTSASPFTSTKSEMHSGFDVDGPGLYKTKLWIACGNFRNSNNQPNLFGPTLNATILLKGPNDGTFHELRTDELLHKE